MDAKTKLLKTLREQAVNFRTAATGCAVAAEKAELLSRRVASIRVSRWREVTKVRLKVGRLYLARRVFPGPYGSACDPAVAEWTDWGWRLLSGNFPGNHGTIEVAI